LLYVADSAHAPYGERHPEYIERRSMIIAQFLRLQPVKAIVVACNTASVIAIESLRKDLDIPIVGIEPAIKPAAELTRSGVVGVMATSATVQSDNVKRLCELYARDTKIILQPCPGLVERIERADLDGPKTISLLDEYLNPMLDAGADTIVLGCTHYPFVAPTIQQRVADSVSIIEPGAAVARQLRRRLEARSLLLGKSVVGVANSAQSLETFFSTASMGTSAKAISALWGRPVAVRYLENL
jgi:glutamate racemase